MDRTLALPLGSHTESTRMRRIYQFTSLVFAIVAVTCGMCLAQSWPPWSDDLFGRRWEDRNQPRRAQPPKDSSERNDDQKGGDIRSGGVRPVIVPVAPPVVAFPLTYPTSSLVIDTGGRKLYYVLPNNKAYAYPISVGREGFDWTGTETISRKQAWPDWYPPTEMRERDSSLPEKMTGGLKNPLGAMALYLGNTLYRIHGTNDVKSIGRAQSSGCFRMLNSAVLHLASLAETGTTVSVVSSLPKQETSQTPEASPPTQAQPRAESAEPPALTVNNAGNRPNLDRVPDYRALRDFTLRK